MSAIVIIDSSVLLNILDVPGRNQERHAIIRKLEQLVENADHLFVPMVAIVEVGNHVAHISDGNQRRKAAVRFVEQVRAAIEGHVPWKPINFPSNEVVLGWLNDFPEAATRQMSMGDLAIKHEFDTLCRRHPMSSVWVWSVDSDLTAFVRMI